MKVCRLKKNNILSDRFYPLHSKTRLYYKVTISTKRHLDHILQPAKDFSSSMTTIWQVSDGLYNPSNHYITWTKPFPLFQ